MISFINFEESSILYQRKFKILYGQLHEISCIKLHTIVVQF